MDMKFVGVDSLPLMGIRNDDREVGSEGGLHLTTPHGDQERARRA